MEFSSTSALATELKIKLTDLCEKLESFGGFERKIDKWILTDLGKQKGKQTGNISKHG